MTTVPLENPASRRPIEAVPEQKRHFEDSVSAHSEEPDHARLRALALREANASRHIASDPDGRLFHALREKAIAARRADNLLRKNVDAGKSDLFEAPRNIVEMPTRAKAVHSFVLALVIVLLAAVATLLASTWYPALHRAMVGH